MLPVNDQSECPELPELGDRKGILAFAQSFNGYRHFGSFKACANAAKSSQRDSLLALRNELFFWYRAANHQGNDGYVAKYEELYPLFKQFTKNV